MNSVVVVAAAVAGKCWNAGLLGGCLDTWKGYPSDLMGPIEGRVKAIVRSKRYLFVVETGNF